MKGFDDATTVSFLQVRCLRECATAAEIAESLQAHDWEHAPAEELKSIIWQARDAKGTARRPESA